MCLCYLFSAKTAWQLVNQKADHSHNESNRIESRTGMLYRQLAIRPTQSEPTSCDAANVRTFSANECRTRRNKLTTTLCSAVLGAASNDAKHSWTDRQTDRDDTACSVSAAKQLLLPPPLLLLLLLHPFNGLFSRITWESQYQKGNQRRWGFGMAVASAGPYANNLLFQALLVITEACQWLHLANTVWLPISVQ